MKSIVFIFHQYILPLMLGLFISMTVVSNATAQNGVNTFNSASKKNTSNIINSSQKAAQMVKQRFGGKVLKATKQGNGYRVKLLKTDGRIVSIYVDAKTGRMK